VAFFLKHPGNPTLLGAALALRPRRWGIPRNAIVSQKVSGGIVEVEQSTRKNLKRSDPPLGRPVGGGGMYRKYQSEYTKHRPFEKP
jgi:hypothetical protein